MVLVKNMSSILLVHQLVIEDYILSKVWKVKYMENQNEVIYFIKHDFTVCG